MEWKEIFAVFAVVLTNLGTIVALFLHSDRKLDDHRKEMADILKGIQTEMKDFHGRLCAIEERNKSK